MHARAHAPQNRNMAGLAAQQKLRDYEERLGKLGVLVRMLACMHDAPVRVYMAACVRASHHRAAAKEQHAPASRCMSGHGCDLAPRSTSFPGGRTRCPQEAQRYEAVNEFSVKSDARVKSTAIKARYEELRARRDADLDARRTRLASKLMKEDLQVGGQSTLGHGSHVGGHITQDRSAQVAPWGSEHPR